ncbi:DUF2264 domain-containing protein [Enterococcus sp. BWM-S5]|uniref:DUF2264 domain-containing protein n=1 Tax=Enterococcus larvae TaxID=2794352 RepID=A0ABS4CEW4_9ENTE|nr:DUF2264 domain-containing protein [Enterococcus larvae]MBP1044651.1 DUF2264 domain-containing protein [Enterococcus larvae]
MNLRKNDFLIKADYAKGLEELLQPLRKEMLEADYPGLHLGSSGAVYDQKRSDMEALIRPLWGLAPYWEMVTDDALRDAYIDKLTKGTDPSSPYYWGDIENYDQYIVEMAALSLTLLLHHDYVWQALTEEAQKNISTWLKQALERKIPKNNWTFFKVLIRVALFHCGEELDRKMLQEELHLIDSMYVGEGWYVDGKTAQRDYYIPFAFHYYGLIYSVYMKEEDPTGAQRFIDRAKCFAQDFIYYFDEDGEALPYGRSLAYRFAQGAFFSALVFADVEARPWGEIKGLLSSHLKNWLAQPIFTFDGRLSIGYHYENMVMAEGYNAPGSPYWALKTFLLLAVPEDHPFWQAEPVQIQKKKRRLVKNGQMLLQCEKAGHHVLGFPAGLFIEGQAHAEAKYSKFVYSTKFGFSVPKAGVRYEEGAFDNTLALSMDACYFRTKGETLNFELSEDHVRHYWSPFSGVEICTELYPLGEWHVRIHEINTQQTLFFREGGFSVGMKGRQAQGTVSGESASVDEGNLTSHIIGIEGYDEAMIVQPEPNTSLFFPRSSFPSLKGKISAGSHRLICLVGGEIKRKEEANE